MSHLKNGIPAPAYYKLLVWKDENPDKFREYVACHIQKERNALHEFSKVELKDLYMKAFHQKIPTP